MLPGLEQLACQDLAVPIDVMEHVVRVESSFNPFAIGVVGARLVRQPRTMPEALATVRMLEEQGYNFSLGLAQVNRYNLASHGLSSYEAAFQPCPNLQAGARILAECRQRTEGDWGKAFSCYYSGNAITGFRHGYVQKVLASIREAKDVEAGGHPIRVVDELLRQRVAVSRYPIHQAPAVGAGADIWPTASEMAEAAAPATTPPAALPTPTAPVAGDSGRTDGPPDHAFVF